MKLDLALPWVCCVSGIQGLQFPMVGSLEFTCCVVCESISEAGRGVAERAWEVWLGRTGKLIRRRVALLAAYRNSPASASAGEGPASARRLLETEPYSLKRNEAFQRNCWKLH